MQCAKEKTRNALHTRQPRTDEIQFQPVRGQNEILAAKTLRDLASDPSHDQNGGRDDGDRDPLPKCKGYGTEESADLRHLDQQDLRRSDEQDDAQKTSALQKSGKCGFPSGKGTAIEFVPKLEHDQHREEYRKLGDIIVSRASFGKIF